jgi:hypothetical protein
VTEIDGGEAERRIAQLECELRAERRARRIDSAAVKLAIGLFAASRYEVSGINGGLWFLLIVAPVVGVVAWRDRRGDRARTAARRTTGALAFADLQAAFDALEVARRNSSPTFAAK